MSVHVAVAGWLLEPSPFSGANRRLTSLLREVPAALRTNERVTVLHRPSFHPPKGFAPIEWRAVDIPSGPTWRRALAEQRTLRALLRELGATVYDHGFLPTPRVGVPLCQTVHDVRDADGEGRWPPWIARAILRRSLRRAAAVITVSDWTAQRLRSLAPGCKPVVIPNGVYEREPGEPPASIPDKGYVLHVGHLERRKNLGVLIRALSLIDTADRPELWLIGRDAGEWPRLRALAAELGVQQHVRYLGPKSDFVLPAYYHDARLVVVPSRYEGFGLPVLEAQVHGTRVAVANAGALPEVVGDGAILPVNDPAAWAAEMATPDREPLDTIRARAARAKQQDWPTAARQWLATLRELSSSPA